MEEKAFRFAIDQVNKNRLLSNITLAPEVSYASNINAFENINSGEPARANIYKFGSYNFKKLVVSTLLLNTSLDLKGFPHFVATCSTYTCQ